MAVLADERGPRRHNENTRDKIMIAVTAVSRCGDPHRGSIQVLNKYKRIHKGEKNIAMEGSTWDARSESFESTLGYR
jgi:hypothetical protein